MTVEPAAKVRQTLLRSRIENWKLYDYRFVRRYLEHHSPPPLSLRQVDPLIRQLNLYRDLIDERTRKPNNEHR